MTSLTGQYFELTSIDRHRFRAFVARPPQKPRGALVLLHEMDARSSSRIHTSAHHNPMPGLSQRIRALVNEHAARGYLVVAPSLFGRGRAGQDHGYRYQMTAAGEQLLKPLQPVDSSRALLDIQTSVAWAQAHVPQGRVGVMGYCWGGLLAWKAACTLPQIFAAVSFYGGGITDEPACSDRPLCPVLVHLPSSGAWMSQASIDQFVAEQRKHSEAPSTAQKHPKQAMVQLEHWEAGYGFDHASSRHHNAQASASARLKSTAFLDKYLNF